MKIIFSDEKESSEHETNAADIAQLFKLADKLSESDLERLKKIVENFRPETVKPSP